MTWTDINDITAALSRASDTVRATFSGRPSRYAVSTFFAVSQQNLRIDFVDLSVSPGGAIVSWAWTFGDGGTSTEQHPSHTYASAGSYTVTLITTDVAGVQGSASLSVTATEQPDPTPEDPIAPVASFTATKSTLTVTFTDTSTDSNGQIVAWEWDFGEGPTSAFTWSVAGLTSTFTNQASAPAPLTVSSYLWNLGDGTTSASSNTQHTYAGGGQKTVSLTVTADNSNTHTLVQTVNIVSGTTGIPLGCTQSFTGASTRASGVTRLNLCMDGVGSGNIIERLSYITSNSLTAILNMTGGSHSNYLTGGVFDSSKWTAKQDTFNTTAIKNAVSAAVASGHLKGCSVMDEPFHHSWGPSGTLTKTWVDRACAHVKSIFSTLPTGVFHSYQEFFPNSSYTICDFIISVYWSRYGNITAWRDATLAMCNRDGHKTVFGHNILDGGTFISGCQSGSGTTCCPQGTTEGPGTFMGADHWNCRSIPSQMTTLAKTIGQFGIGYLFWRYDAEAMSTGSWAALNQAAFQEIKDYLDALPASTWTRS